MRLHWKTHWEETGRNSPGYDEFPDIELKAEDGSVKAHKVILAAASPFFDALFSRDFKEKTQSVIDLSATFPAVYTLKNFVKYIYGVEIDMTEENIGSYLVASSFFLISSLSEECITYLFQNLNPSNCLLFWNLAEIFDLQKLMRACKKMAADNFRAYLRDDENVLKLSSENLKTYLKGGITRYCKTDEVVDFIKQYISQNNICAPVMDFLQFHESTNTIPESINSDLEDVIFCPCHQKGANYVYHIRGNQWYKTPERYLANNIKLVKVGVGTDQILVSTIEPDSDKIYYGLCNIFDPNGTQAHLQEVAHHVAEAITRLGGQKHEQEQSVKIKYFTLTGKLFCIGTMLNDNYKYEFLVIFKYSGSSWLVVNCYRSAGLSSLDRVSITPSENEAYIMVHRGEYIRVLKLNTEGKLELFSPVKVNAQDNSVQRNICFSEGSVYLLLGSRLLRCVEFDSQWEMVHDDINAASFYIRDASTELNIFSVSRCKYIFRYSLQDNDLVPLKPAPWSESVGPNIHLTVEKVPLDFMELLYPLSGSDNNCR